jgi:hypothetical protein
MNAAVQRTCLRGPMVAWHRHRHQDASPQSTCGPRARRVASSEGNFFLTVAVGFRGLGFYDRGIEMRSCEARALLLLSHFYCIWECQAASVESCLASCWWKVRSAASPPGTARHEMG